MCEGAPVTCKYCKENVLRKDIERHERHECVGAPRAHEAVEHNRDQVKFCCCVCVLTVSLTSPRFGQP